MQVLAHRRVPDCVVIQDTDTNWLVRARHNMQRTVQCVVCVFVLQPTE